MLILIASNRAVTRRALAGLLQTRSDLDLAGEAANAEQVLVRAKATNPDIVLLDWDLQNGPLENLVSRLHQLTCQPKVVALGFSSESEQAARAAGTDAFVSKGDPPRYLLTAIYGVYPEGQE